MKRRLEKYGFSKQVVDTIRPIIESFEQNETVSAEEGIAELALDVCSKVEKGLISQREADTYFTLIDLYVGDYHPKLKLGAEVRDLIFEGMILHDYGKDYGADLNVMRTLANKILRRKKTGG